MSSLWEFAQANLEPLVFWKNSDVAFDPDGVEIDDQLGVAIVPERDTTIKN